MRRVLVVGLGGVGGYVAAKFAKSGINVVGVARGEHKRAIEQNGLCVKEDGSEFCVRFPTYSIEELKGEFDVALFCVKSYDLALSAKAIKSYLSKDAIAISFANGVDNGDVLRNVLDCDVLDGAIYILSSIEASGVICKKGDVFAAVFGGKRADELAQLFEKSNLRYKISLDIKKDLWKKYIFIAAFANLTSYFDKTISQIYKEHYDEAKAVLEEIALVAKYEGIDITKEIEKSLQTASKLPKSATTSMHLDFQKKKQTELQSLSATLIDLASKHHLQLPHLEKIYKALKERT